MYTDILPALQLSGLYRHATLSQPWRRLTVRLSKALPLSAKAANPTYFVSEQLIRSNAVPRIGSKPAADTDLSSSSSASASSHKKLFIGRTDWSDRSPVLYDSDPFSAEPVACPLRPPAHLATSAPVSQGDDVVDPNTIVPSPPSSCIATPASITPSSAISSAETPFRKSLQRIKTFTRHKLFSSHQPTSDPTEVHRTLPDGPSEPESTAAASLLLSPPRLPELSFDSTPLSSLVPQDQEYAPDPAVSHPERQENLIVPAASQPRFPARGSLPATAFPLIKWERVDPKDLTPSPYSVLTTDLTADVPSLAPSPSWLSRNVRDFEPQLIVDPPEDTPPSPEPLPILPRSLLPVVSRPPSVFDSPAIVVSTSFVIEPDHI